MTTTPLRRRRDERGSVLILATVGLVLAIISAALAIDLGFLAHEVRVDQKVADLAALDAVRVLPADPTAAAQASATRNGFPYSAAGYALVVRWGPSKTGPWSSDASTLGTATAVQVSATSPHQNFFPFVAGGQTKTRSAVAAVDDKAQFSVGSKLGELDSGDDTNLDRVMTAILGTSPAVNLTVVGYQGLAGGSVSLADLVAADPSLGTPDTLLTSSITVRRLAQATLTALNNKGDAASLAAATPLGTFANNIDTSLKVKLVDILSVEQPADPGSVAAEAQFNVFDLITGAGMAGVSDGTHFVNVPNMTVTVPGLASASMKLTVIEPPRISAFGPARYDTATNSWVTTARTAQVRVELTSHIVTCDLLNNCVDLRMPLMVSAAKATGSLIDIRCPSGSITREADIEVVTTGANGTADNVLAVKLLGIPLSLPPVIHTDVALAGGTTTPAMTFSGPPFPTPIQSTAATGAGLTTATTSQFTVLGANLATVLGLLNPVTSAMDEQILEPVFNALGLSVGGADVRTLRIECGVPGLVA